VRWRRLLLGLLLHWGWRATAAAGVLGVLLPCVLLLACSVCCCYSGGAGVMLVLVGAIAVGRRAGTLRASKSGSLALARSWAVVAGGG
jgi:hypothetical protein